MLLAGEVCATAHTLQIVISAAASITTPVTHKNRLRNVIGFYIYMASTAHKFSGLFFRLL